MFELEVANPVAPAAVVKIDSARRPSDLAGKRVGLYWNYKPGGDVALERVAQVVAERYPNVSFVRERGTVGALVKHLTPDAADRFAESIDVVVGTTGD